MVPLFTNFLKNLHHENSDCRVFAAGYSWGAREAMLLASKDSNTKPNDGFKYVEAIYAASLCKLTLSDVLKHFSLGITFWLFWTRLMDVV